MATMPWIKLYTEILDDPKMGRMNDHLYRRTIEMFLIAGKILAGGYLPSVDEIAWMLRRSEDEIRADLEELQTLGIVEEDADGLWMVVKFADRQDADTNAERQARYRERQTKKKYYGENGVTKRNANSNDDSNEMSRRREEEEKRREEEEINPVTVLLSAWGDLFPKKPQPKPETPAIKDKVKARWKSTHFRENWQQAMAAAARSPTCQAESWFDFKFFVKNDENYQKCLDNWMAWKDKQMPPKNGSSGVIKCDNPDGSY
jgi:uncharacterized protein YdbL (DUF1318 family)